MIEFQGQVCQPPSLTWIPSDPGVQAAGRASSLGCVARQEWGLEPCFVQLGENTSHPSDKVWEEADTPQKLLLAGMPGEGRSSALAGLDIWPAYFEKYIFSLMVLLSIRRLYPMPGKPLRAREAVARASCSSAGRWFTSSSTPAQGIGVS